MAIRIASNLHRNRHGVLYFRIAVPKDLRPRFAVQEIYKSLHTSSIREATEVARTLTTRYKELFKELRQLSMKSNKKPPIEPSGEIQVNLVWRYDITDPSGLRLTGEIHKEAHDTQEEFTDAIKTVTRHFYSPRATHKVIDSQDSTFGLRLSEYVEDFIKDINASREDADKINEQGLEDHRFTCRVLIEIIGDKQLSDLSIKDRNRFNQVIKRYPSNREKVKTTRGKPLEEILSMTDYRVINLKTAKFHASRANTFLNWCFNQVGQALPFKLLTDVKIKKGKGAAKKRREFKNDELSIVFAPETFPFYSNNVDKSPYKFWIPLIGLHTGARLNEIAQLLIGDIIQKDGIWCFDLTDTPDQDEPDDYLGKSLKTYAAKRLVPIHSKLIEMGLIEYAQSVKRSGYSMLFQDLAHASIKYGALASKTFATHCDAVGLTDQALSFHSFRHCTIGHLRKKRVPKDIRKILVGHSAADDTHDGVYGDIQSDISIKMRKEAIEQLDFSECISFDQLMRKAPTITDLNEILLKKAKLEKN